MPDIIPAWRREGRIMEKTSASVLSTKSTARSDRKGSTNVPQPTSSEDHRIGTTRPNQPKTRMASVAATKAANRPR